MTSASIKSPNFQKLQALEAFEFRHLNPVVCNLCQSGERDILFEEGVFEVVRCRNCGLLYVTPQPSDTDLQEYYRHFFSGSPCPDDKRWHNARSFDQAFGYLQRFSKDRDMNILEIGCGYGYFLELLFRQGYKNTTGIEPDKEIYDTCKRKNPQAQNINGEFVSYNFKERKFDVIVMLASLEHFLDPLQVLKKAYDLLNKGGLIVIRVPCLEGFFTINRFLGRTVVPFGAPRHLYDFNKNTLKKIIQSAGFKTLALSIGANETASSYIYDKLIKIIKVISFCGDKAGCRFMSLFFGSLIIVGKKQ